MGYGTELHLEYGGRTLITKPYCSTHLDTEHWEGSAHAFLVAKDVWAAKGVVAGQGAPNLWYRDAHLGADARVWWYKYVGRYMRVSITSPIRHLHQIIDAARPLVVDHIGGLLPNLWSNA